MHRILQELLVTSNSSTIQESTDNKFSITDHQFYYNKGRFWMISKDFHFHKKNQFVCSIQTLVLWNIKVCTEKHHAMAYSPVHLSRNLDPVLLPKKVHSTSQKWVPACFKMIEALVFNDHLEFDNTQYCFSITI